MADPETDLPFFEENNAPDGGGSIAARALAASRPAGADYLEGLNPEQAEAVKTVDGPLLVLAGAGTGKTRVLTTRIAHILSQGLAFPSQILAVTFTNKAAREMKHRIMSYLGHTVEGMTWLGTFHSVCVKILRRHAELVDLKSDFTILDMDDQIRLLKQLIRAHHIDDKRWPARQLAGMIDGWKNKALGPSEIGEDDNFAFAGGKGRELYQAYQDRLKILNAVDFGDLLTECIRLFRQQPDVLSEYHSRFRFILVDEYQDTNVAQYLWLRLLVQKKDEDPSPKNICCVGDDDQSIYGWRGAEVDNILRFERDFPGAKTIRLERNYRSTSHILAAASKLISHNEDRLGKTLFTDLENPDEAKVKVTANWDSEEEARRIGEEIEQYQRNSIPLNQIAVLVRASFQMREFEDRFITLGLNYRVIGGPRFYERLEIRDALAYFRIVCQFADDLAFERIINTPKRGIGEASVRIIHDNARARSIPLLQAARDLIDTDDIKPRTRTSLKQLIQSIDTWHENLEAMPHNELAEMILEESGYTQMWQNDRSADAPGRLENLKELVRSMEEFDSMAGFLEHISLVMDRDSEDASDAVSLMTLHSAKGLEFDVVFLPGWEEGLFPHQRALDEGGLSGLEEERRLAYVGITRARKHCEIHFTSNRRVHGLWQTSVPSRFLDELPEKHVEIAEGGRSYGDYANSRFDTRDPFATNYQSPGWKRAQAKGGEWASHKQSSGRFGQPRKKGPQTIEGELIASAINETNSLFKVGDRVFHLKFGNGNIAAIEGNKLTINFDRAGQKRVLDSFVQAS